MTTFTCPACGTARLRTFYSVDRVPVNSCVMLEDAAAAKGFPTGSLRIAACSGCGFVTNTAFNPALTTYADGYEESQGCSPRFRGYMDELAADWVRRYGLAGTTVVELGCGKGEFLGAMIRAGVGHGIGVDPAVQPDRVDTDVVDRTTWIAGRFPDDYPRLDAAAVICRHTLEHLAPVRDWLVTLRQALGDRTDTVLLFEVPDTLRVLREGAFWDVYYEHCSYFSAGSLDALFRRCGFEPVELRRTYDDQYLVIEARPAARPPAATTSSTPVDDRDDLLTAAATFGSRHELLATRWRAKVRKIAETGGQTVLWGASSKAVGFLAALGDDARHVAGAVDINPYKQGRYLAGTGHRVVAPTELPALSPELVVAMNPTYLTEIGRDLDALRVPAPVEAL